MADRAVNPVFHLDTNASARERRGEPTEIGTSASIERSLRVLERTERQYKEAIAAARQDVARWKDSPEARPLIAEYLTIRRRQASLTRERALFQEAKRAALSRPTAAMRHFERLAEPLKAAPGSPNRAGRLAGLNRKIAEHQRNIDEIRRTLDPLWDGLEARSSDLRQQDLPRLEQLTRALDGIARQRSRIVPTRDDQAPAR